MEKPLILESQPSEGYWLNIVDAATLNSGHDHIREEYVVGQNILHPIQHDDLGPPLIQELKGFNF